MRTLLETQQGEYLAHGIHVIIAQSADGSLVVGDSHHYETADQPFDDAGVERLILQEYRRISGSPAPAVRERWSGTYAVAPDRALLVDAPGPRVRLVIITSGIGASTGFAIGEEVINELFDSTETHTS